MLKNSESNETEEFGLVTPTSGHIRCQDILRNDIDLLWSRMKTSFAHRKGHISE